jgi:hypothetical protein
MITTRRWFGIFLLGVITGFIVAQAWLARYQVTAMSGGGTSTGAVVVRLDRWTGRIDTSRGPIFGGDHAFDIAPQ